MGDIDETTGLSFLTNMRRMEEDNTSKRLLPNKDCSMTIDNALWNFLKNLRKRYNFKLETLAHGLYLFYSSSTILTKQEDKDDETDQNSKDDKQDKFVLSLCIYISAKYL